MTANPNDARNQGISNSGIDLSHVEFQLQYHKS